MSYKHTEYQPDGIKDKAYQKHIQVVTEMTHYMISTYHVGSRAAYICLRRAPHHLARREGFHRPQEKVEVLLSSPIAEGTFRHGECMGHQPLNSGT